MLSSSNITSTNSTNTAQYLTSDRTELAPLCSTHQDSGGLRIVISVLTIFTVFVSMALVTQLHHGDFQVVSHGIVVSDNSECSTAGVNVMKKEGSAVDAVITTLFCLSVVLPHLVGIGGGGSLLVYNQQKRQIVGCLDFQATLGTNHSSIGVPGFVAGLYQAHKSYGKLPWSVLLEVAIDIAGSGFKPSENLQSVVPLAAGRENIVELLTSGKNPSLHATLQAIAQDGPDVLYNGSLSNQIDYFTKEELTQYQVISDSCTEQTIGQYNIAVGGPRSGGPLLIELLKKFYQSLDVDKSILSLAEKLKETRVVSRPYSTGVNVVVADHNDIYVSAVSGLGSVLGSLELTSGGYLMNNISHAGEDSHPATLGSPIVITESNSVCGKRFILGANDLRDAAQVLLRLLVPPNINMNYTSLKSLMDAPRVKIMANQIQLEINQRPQLDPNLLVYLKDLNYSIGSSSQPYPSLNLIHKKGDDIIAIADSRGKGSPASF